jgi:hypothetical protein
VDFFHRLTRKFRRLKSERLEDWLCLRHQVKYGGGGGGVINLFFWVLLIELVPTTGPNRIGLLPLYHPQSQSSKRYDFNLLNFVVRRWKKSTRMMLLIINDRQNFLVFTLIFRPFGNVRRVSGVQHEPSCVRSGFQSRVGEWQQYFMLDKCCPFAILLNSTYMSVQLAKFPLHHLKAQWVRAESRGLVFFE